MMLLDIGTNAPSILQKLADKFFTMLPTIFVALIVFVVGIIVAKLLSKIVTRALKKATVEGTATSFGRSLGRILLYTILIIICLTILGVPMTSIIAVVGAAGLAVGLALQNSLSNVAGGFIILFSKIFVVGDYIIVGDAEGYVSSVSILYTKLTARDNRTIYLPNGNISSGQIINLSQQGTLKLCIPLSIAYDADLNKARHALLKAVKNVTLCLQNPAPSVTMSAHADSAVSLSLNVWVKSEDYFDARPQILEQAKEALDQAKIEIPFPQVVVHNA